MNADSIVKNDSWIFPEQSDTPDGSQPVPILLKVFSYQEEIKKNVTVKEFVNQLTKVMKDIEARMRMLCINNRKI